MGIHTSHIFKSGFCGGETGGITCVSKISTFETWLHLVSERSSHHSLVNEYQREIFYDSLVNQCFETILSAS